VKHTRAYFSFFLLLIVFCAYAPVAGAQSSVDFNIGFGTAHAKAGGFGIDSASSSTNAFGSCITGTGDPFCQSTPSLNGFFLGFGGDVMLYKHIGFGAEASFTPSRRDYGPLQYRQTFYDFNGIYAPISAKRAVLQLQGGLGGAKTGFAFSQSACVGSAVCTNQTLPVGNSNHFQLHFGAGVQIFVTQHWFIKPQFDLHYVPNFTDQFGSNTVPAGMVWVGYNFGNAQ